MSGYESKIVEYNDPWDCGKFDSIPEKYQLFHYGTSDVIEFKRNGKCLVALSKGEACLFMRALEHFFEDEGIDKDLENNPFKGE